MKRDIVDTVRVLAALGLAEVGRRRIGPGRLVAWARRMGRTARARGPEDRARLRRIISLCDWVLPGAPNCYRRSLVELALDGNAAKEPFVIGLTQDGGPRSGHAWLGSARGRTAAYDVEFIL